MFIRRQFWFLAVLAGIALIGSLRLTVTEDFRSGANVLGEEDAGQSALQAPNGGEAQPQQKGNFQVNGTAGGAGVQNSTGGHLYVKTPESSTVTTNGSGGEGAGYEFQFEVGGNGKVELQAQNKEGEKLQNKEFEKQQIEQDLEKQGINVSSEDGRLAIEKENVSAVSHFPLSVNPTTKELTVTTPAGVKTVTVLPNEAIQNFLAHGIVPISTVTTASASGSGSVPGASPSAALNPLALTLHNSELVYQTQGQESHNLFGFIPVTINTTAYLSAENGALVAQTQTLLDRLIAALSF